MSSRIKNKTEAKGHGSTLEETQPDHAMSSATTDTKLLLGCVNLNKKKKKKNNNNNNKKKKMEKCGGFRFGGILNFLACT